MREKPVRIVVASAVALSVVILGADLRVVCAQETIVMDGDASPSTGGACGCRDTQAPPWHGNVVGDACGPSCPPPTMFHADPCRQLWLKHNARQQGCALPPCFPRLHGYLTDGSMPTPRPIVMPRCPRCGAHIEGGF